MNHQIDKLLLNELYNLFFSFYMFSMLSQFAFFKAS